MPSRVPCRLGTGNGKPAIPDAHVDHAADDLIETAVAALLRRVPERWEEYDADSLTATESKVTY